MRHFWRRSFAIGSLIGLALLVTLAAWPSTALPATPTPSTTPGATLLMQRAVSPMPAAPLTTRLLQIQLQAGASVPMHTHPGPEFDLVLNGTLTVMAKGGAIITRAGGKTETTKDGATSTVNTGEFVTFPAGVGMELANEGSGDLTLLSTVVLPVGGTADNSIMYSDGTPSARDFQGVSFTVLGDGLMDSFPAGDGTVSVQKITVAAGSPVPAATMPVLRSRISGDYSFQVESGNVQVTRSASPGLQPNALPNALFTLGTGDAAFFPNGVKATDRPANLGPLAFYQLAITPKTAVGGSPATLKAIAASQVPKPTPTPTKPAATKAATPAASPVAAGTIKSGTIVVTTADGVNLRDDATTSGNIVDTVDSGTQFQVTGAPKKADGYTWYPVHLVGDATTTGWIASDFIKPQNQGATPVASPAASPVASPSASPIATEPPAPTKAAATKATTPATTKKATSAASPAASPKASPAASPGATPKVSGTPGATPVAKQPYKKGTIVVTTDDGVRLRPDPSINAEPIDAYDKGTQFEITGAPKEADGYTWYPVKLVGSDQNITGWIGSEFIKPK